MASKQSRKTTVIMLSGYRGVGKNTFALKLAEHNSFFNRLCEKQDVEIEKLPFNYRIFKKKDVKIREFPPKGQIKERSFARILKETVGRSLHLSHDEVDAQKECRLDPLERLMIYNDHGIQLPKTATIRHALIAVAEHTRENNPDFFVNHIIASGLENDGSVYVITDWRYPNEHARMKEYCEEQGFELITARICRSGIPIPDRDVKSEWSLLGFEPDLLIIPLDDPEMDVVLALHENYEYWRTFD